MQKSLLSQQYTDGDCTVRAVPLRTLTTLRLGGVASVITPNHEAALVECLTRIGREGARYHILGNGSNTLATDDPLETPVLHTKRLNNVSFCGNLIEVSAGCMLPRLIRQAAEENLGGIEYLASVPGTIGGAICMNAGRGERSGVSINERVISVRLFDGKRIRTFSRQQLNSSYRWTVFRDHPEFCILSAKLRLDSIPREEVLKRVASRLERTRKLEDHSGPNAGSVFRVKKQFASLAGRSVGNARFSALTPNWILSTGASSRELVDLIEKVGSLDELEWSVWQS